MKTLPIDDHNQGIFFPQIRALFSNFWKRAEETSPPLPSSYAHVLFLLILTFGETFGVDWEKFMRRF